MYWGSSSVGRAVRSQRTGQRFDPALLHFSKEDGGSERNCRFAFGVDLRLTGFSAAGENIAHHIDEVGHGYIAVTVNITHLEWTWCFA